MDGKLRLGLNTSLSAIILLSGCTTRKTAAPPAPSHPAVPANSVHVLDRLPAQPYDVVSTITVQTRAETNRDKIIAEMRQKAGNSGADVMVIVSDKVFTWRNETIHQRLPTRRIVAVNLALGSTEMTNRR